MLLMVKVKTQNVLFQHIHNYIVLLLLKTTATKQLLFAIKTNFSHHPASCILLYTVCTRYVVHLVRIISFIKNISHIIKGNKSMIHRHWLKKILSKYALYVNLDWYIIIYKLQEHWKLYS